MPAKATLYDNKSNALFDFGTASRNEVFWAPHGRFLCIAGLGNLAGDVDFWDRYKLKKMGTTNASCAVQCMWTPDSRWFVTATTHPRLRVDNGFKVFRYNGCGPEVVQARDELYSIQMRPAVPGLFPDRPQSPLLKGQRAAARAATASKPKAYRAPGSTGSLSMMLKRESGVTGSGGKKLGGVGGSGIPGMAKEQGPSRNQKRREAKKKAEAEAKAAEEAAAAAAAAAAASKKDNPSLMTPEEKAKALKKLNKKLKQLDDIKKKAADGTELNEDQKAKLASETQLRDDIKKIESC
jgi:translation initiation factor 2A